MKASYVLWYDCGCACVRTWLLYVRTVVHVRICTYECIRRYFIGSHIVACVCKFWFFLISLLVVSDALMYTVKIINGRSVDIWHVCMKTAIHRADRKLSTSLCDDSSHHLTILKNHSTSFSKLKKFDPISICPL